MLLATVEEFAQYGLVGLMIAAIFAGIAWAGQRLLGKDGVLELHATALERVADCVQSLSQRSESHTSECLQAHAAVNRLHAAASKALDEIEDECRLRGQDVTVRIDRVRDALRG